MLSPATLLSPTCWAQETFGSARLGDPRRRKRALAIAASMARQPGGTFPQQMDDPAASQGAYRFFHSPDVSYEALIGPHLEQTGLEAGEHHDVLLIQDTTELDFHHYPKTTGLGPIGNGSREGILLQSVLAVLPQSLQVLGLVHQEPFLRQPAPKKETKEQRLKRERESQVWERSVQAIGTPPAGVRWVHVGDRYSDIFSFLRLCRDTGCDFLIRAAQDRTVDLLVEQAQTPAAPRSHHHPSPALHLFEVVDALASRCWLSISIDASQKRAARTAQVQVSWQAIRLLPPRTREHQGWLPLVTWVIHVWEPNAPEEVEALEWVLLTSLPTQTLQEAEQRIASYRARWIIEDFHQGIKTGCQMEHRHFHDAEALRRVLGMTAPLAVRLIQLRAASRQDPDQMASEVVPSEVVAIVAHLVKADAHTMTVQQCWYGIARSGGYLGRKGDGPPGWKTLWKGWLHIQTLLDGVHLAPFLSQLNL